MNVDIEVTVAIFGLVDMELLSLLESLKLVNIVPDGAIWVKPGILDAVR